MSAAGAEAGAAARTRTQRCVALLRGINVGRAKRVAMADLRALLESLGYRNVRTLLNSGNAVFDAPAKARAGHAPRIQAAVLARLAVDARVIVKSADEFAAVVAGNPLLGRATDPSRLLVALTDGPARLPGLADLVAMDWSPDALAIAPHAAYLWCAQGVLESKLAQAVGRRLGDAATTRNWATVEKLQALLQSGGR